MGTVPLTQGGLVEKHMLVQEGRVVPCDLSAVHKAMAPLPALDDLQFNCTPDREVQLRACARRFFLGKTPSNLTDALKLKAASDSGELVLHTEKYLKILGIIGPE